jgi:hypothetical protein
MSGSIGRNLISMVQSKRLPRGSLSSFISF